MADSNIATEFGLRRGGGFHLTEPWELGPAKVAAAANLLMTEAVGPTNRTSAVAAFWTMIGYNGTAVDTDFTANTYKALLNVSSGKGLINTVIGPTAGGAETTTFEFTLDSGAAVEIAIPVTAGQRAMLGVATMTTLFTLAGASQIADIAAFNAGKTIQTLTANHVIPNWTFLQAQGIPSLRFASSVLVRAKHSANVTGTANQERQAGLIHMTGG